MRIRHCYAGSSAFLCSSVGKYYSTVSKSNFSIQFLILLLLFSPFYRYFRVDLERPCPFWKEDGQCAYEGCSVCTCDETEIPRAWIVSKDNDDQNPTKDLKEGDGEFGWFSPTSSRYGNGLDGHDDSLGRLDLTTLPQSTYGGGFEKLLRDKQLNPEEDHGNKNHILIHYNKKQQLVINLLMT